METTRSEAGGQLPQKGAGIHAPFGGYKKSGIGRETHKMILEHLTQKKNIFISLSGGKLGLYSEFRSNAYYFK